jgi:hypothetical protein
MQTLVTRLPADKQGPDISDQLLTTVDAQIERGRGEINENSTSRVMVSANCPATAYIEPGSTVCVTDMERGNWYGVVDSWALNIDIKDATIEASTSLVIERE